MGLAASTRTRVVLDVAEVFPVGVERLEDGVADHRLDAALAEIDVLLRGLGRRAVLGAAGALEVALAVEDERAELRRDRLGSAVKPEAEGGHAVGAAALVGDGLRGGDGHVVVPVALGLPDVVGVQDVGSAGEFRVRGLHGGDPARLKRVGDACQNDRGADGAARGGDRDARGRVAVAALEAGGLAGFKLERLFPKSRGHRGRFECLGGQCQFDDLLGRDSLPIAGEVFGGPGAALRVQALRNDADIPAFLDVGLHFLEALAVCFCKFSDAHLEDTEWPRPTERANASTAAS